MRSNERDVEKLLEELRDELRQLREKVESPLPRMLTYERAAQELSVSVTKVKQLVRAGALATCEVGKRKHVPRIEIERIERSASFAATPRSAPRPARARAERRPYNAKEEAAKARAALKKG